MYRFFSLLNSLIVVVFSGLSFFYYNDDFGWEIPFFSDIIFYTSIALLFGLIIKAQIRWQKLLLTIKLDGFSITANGWKKSLINEYLALHDFCTDINFYDKFLNSSFLLSDSCEVVRISILQPERALASLTFWPFLPIARLS